ncbi:MAG: glycosyltransferase family 2 protein [Deltaproteobacteria bacterium]|nr:glycosyltransferase family 2 protein [Deltaproteobacteria bacterium]
MNDKKNNINKSLEKFPLVSVVVPTYNHSSYISDCLKSITSQDYPNIELIVINDGSTDKTDEVIKKFISETDFEIKYTTKKNEGVGKTMSLGLKQASGEYFCELCSDDLLPPTSISRRVEYMEAHKSADVVFGRIRAIDAQGVLIEPSGDKEKPGFDSELHTFEEFVQNKAIITFHTGMSRTSALREVGGFDEDFYTEDTYIRYLLVVFKEVAFLDEPVVDYRHHGTNISKGKPFWMRSEKILSFEKLLSRVEEISEKVELRNIIKEQLFSELLKYLKIGFKVGEKRMALAIRLKKALGLRPLSLKANYYRLKLASYNKESGV